MMKKKEIISLIIFSFFILGFISYFTVSHIASLRKLNESANDTKDIEPDTFLDLNDKKTMDEVYLKILHYKSIEREPVRHLSISELEEEEKEEAKKLRNLEASNTFENAGLVDPTTESTYYTMRLISGTIKQFSSNIIFYPYSFNYSYQIQNESGVIPISKQFRQGAFISLNSSELDRFNNIGLKTNGTFSTKKSRIVFDADFAILSVEYLKNYNYDETFQDAIDWSTYFQNLYGKGTTLSSFEEFLQYKAQNSSRTYITKINETEVIKGSLLNDGLPRFGILLIPDYILGYDGIIKSKLGQKGINNIIDYYNKGGKIIVNGKSGTLLEDFGLMTKGVYNRKKLLSINNANRFVQTKGCDEAIGNTYKENVDDFYHQTICMSIINGKQVTLASSFKSVKADSNYETLINLDSNNRYLVTTDVDNGLSFNLTEEEKKYNPLVLFRKNNNNGYIFVLNYNPVYSNGEKSIVLNAIVLSLSKELYMTSKVNMNRDVDSNLIDNMPIPAGEFGFQLEINTIIHNLNDKEMSESKLYLFLPDNFGWSSIPSNCEEKKYVSSGIPINIRQRKTIESNNNYLLCNLKSIAPYQKSNFQITITVLNNQATQQKYQVVILEPILSYLDSNKQENIIVDQVKANCEPAPVLRSVLNPDPSSIYPLPGRGYYVDNVVKVENKEQTLAYDVEYYGLIPLISPIVDGDDQRRTQWSMKIYVDYYNSNNFEVPLTSPNATDYIYPAQLMGKSVNIAMEWDSPVLPSKIIDNENEGGGKEVNIKGLNFGSITLNSTSEAIKQVNYRTSNRFFKLASQRLMAFVDTSTPEGAQAIYNGKIPEKIMDPVYKDRTKKDLLYARLDIYFYENENYCNPRNITENDIFSVDRYKAYNPTSNCVKNRGEAESKILEKGFFTNLEEDKKDIILKPNEYSNELFDYCDLTVIDPTTQQDIINKRFGEENDFKLIHYIIPNVEKDIIRPGQLYNFTEKDEHNGQHDIYPSIKFIYLHSLTYILNSKYCSYGGRIIVDIGDLELGSIDDVTVSPDQIAVYKIEYNDHKINIYFKRGLMSNEQFGKNVVIIINIENLNKPQNLTFDFTVEEMKFDISYGPYYERYTKIISEKKEFAYISVFSYPALQIKTKLNRTLNGYETKEPFSRYGVYAQELYHRTVYTFIETLFQSDPGVLINANVFSFISNLGISSIPFVEYMSVGKGQVIPAGPSTSRITWKDVWGRTWQQPLRSSFPDVPPLPPPLRNFMMTTTYEIIRGDNQIYEWPSDENVKIHLHIKLLNNYPKYFEITRCKENQIKFVPFELKEDHYREFQNKSTDNLTESEMNGDKMLLREGGMASYGVCYADEKAYVQGTKVEGELLEKIKKAKLCADYTEADMIAKCSEELKDIKIITRCPKGWDQEKDGIWNYSPLVEKYYPKGYIEKEMWEMSIIDYDDTTMDKAYRYHFDNLVPNYDNINIKPHNAISIPIYKGLGYNIVYDKNISMVYHGSTKRGWWSDNLQNKDDTLLAGQEESNTISIDKTSKLKWVNGKELVGSKREGSQEAIKDILKERLSNIYVCLFNRKRPEYTPNNGKSYHARNVVENNIVPIIVDLEKDDKRLYGYECNGDDYTPDNLYTLEDNYLETPTSKDYLYFAANLRAHAKESFNILMILKMFDKVKYEGDVKVNEGGRFVYWNPVNGPNSFLVVDDPVNIIKAKRNDIQIINNIFPGRVSTFNSIIYHSYIFRDEDKINKEWPYTNYYTNSYGFGDVAVSVSIGGIRKSKPVLEPGKTTYAKIIFYNNCGYDWNMKSRAIEFKELDQRPLNAEDLLYRYVHAIQLPTAYNFLKWKVEEEYKDYIEIKPSGHNIDVAPEFFDFENINLVTIRDGFKGEYSLEITVKNDFPEKLRGKPIEIKVELDYDYFEHFPGYTTDLVPKYHKYNVTIPSIYIAVPFNSGEFKGKVLYTTAQASNLNIEFEVGVDWKIDGIKYIKGDLLEKMTNSTLGDEAIELIDGYWDELKNEKNISYSEKLNKDNNGNTKIVTIDGIKDKYELFPKKVIGGPDIAEDIIIIRSITSQLSYGYSRPIWGLKIKYKDWIDKNKVSTGTTPYIQGVGPWITLSYSRTLVEYLGKGSYLDKVDQTLSPDESGTMKVQFLLLNSGNANTFDTKYEIVIEPNLTFVEHNAGTNKIDVKKNEYGQTILTFDYGAPIMAGEPKGGIIYLNYTGICESYDILTPEEKKALPKALPVANRSAVYMKLSNSTTAKNATQQLRQPLIFTYTIKEKTSVFINLVLSGRRSNPTVTIKPKIKYYGNDTEKKTLISIGKYDDTKYYKEMRKLDEENIKNYKYISIYDKNNFIKQYKDYPCQKEKDNKNHVVFYTVLLYRKMENGKDVLISSSTIKFEQRNVHLSTAEAVLIILSIIFYSIAAFFIWRGYSNWKEIRSTNSGKVENDVKSAKLDRLLA